MEKTDKGRWFTDDGKSFIRCSREKLVDCLTDIFKDRQKARVLMNRFRPATLEEYASHELYNI